MLIHVDRESRTPLYLQIKNQIRDMIFSGVLSPGFRLPPERKLAETLNVNRSTVLNAYHELKADRLIESRVGCGTVVLEPHSAARGQNAPFACPEPIHWRQFFSVTSSRQQNPLLQDLMQLLHRREDVISFSLGIPAVELYPISVFQDIQSEILKKHGQATLSFLPTEGYYPLRESISRFMRKSGAAVSPEEILVLSGSQQGIDLAARTLIDPGDVILAEEPSFFCAVQVFRSAGARVIGVPIDENGMRTDLLESFLARYKPKFIYTIPNFQNPSGTVMSPERRRQMLNLAYSYRTPILEDDAYGELRYEGQPVTSLKALDQHGYVIYLSTFSKTLSPGVRIGWLAAARPVIRQIVMAKQLNDIHTNSLAQFVLDGFLRRGLFEQHLQMIRQEYVKRRNMMMDALQKSMLPGVCWNVPEGGLYLWCRLPERIDKSTVLLMRAIDQGVTFVPGEAFYLEEQGCNHIRLNFALQPKGVIEEGVKRLVKALRETLVSTESLEKEIKAQTNPLF